MDVLYDLYLMMCRIFGGKYFGSMDLLLQRPHTDAPKITNSYKTPVDLKRNKKMLE